VTPGQDEWTPPFGAQNPAYSLLQPLLLVAYRPDPQRVLHVTSRLSAWCYPDAVKDSWPTLRREEPIGIVALAGPAEQSKLEAGLTLLEQWGNPVLVAPNVLARTSYLAGDDDARLMGLEWVLDRGARLLVAARGGYGVLRLLQRLPWQRLIRDRVQLVGFSDLTALLNPLVDSGGAPQVHGPMVAAGLARARSHRRLRQVLTGELVGKVLFRFGQDAVYRHGKVVGRAMGGNLTMLAALAGTGFAPSYDGAVLFLEEVGEPLYRLDRCVTQLALSGCLSGVKALIGGSLRGCHPTAERDDAWRRMLA